MATRVVGGNDAGPARGGSLVDQPKEARLNGIREAAFPDVVEQEVRAHEKVKPRLEASSPHEFHGLDVEPNGVDELNLPALFEQTAHKPPRNAGLLAPRLPDQEQTFGKEFPLHHPGDRKGVLCCIHSDGNRVNTGRILEADRTVFVTAVSEQIRTRGLPAPFQRQGQQSPPVQNREMNGDRRTEPEGSERAPNTDSGKASQETLWKRFQYWFRRQ